MSLTVQFYTMFAMALTGVWIGAAFDTFTRLLKRNFRKTWIVFINDILFWIVQGLVVFYVLFIVNEGELRLIVFAALLCGYAFYQALVKEWYVKVLEHMITLIKKLIHFLVSLFKLFILTPLKWVMQTLAATALFLAHLLLRIVMIAVKIVIWPVRWLGMLLWRITPNKIKKYIENGAGKYKVAKKYLLNQLEKFKK